MKKIILASASPRRRELLTLAGVNFSVKCADADETLPQGISPREAVELLAQKKAAAVALSHADCAVIGADTVVSVQGKILGKPADYDEAFEMLSLLSGKAHSVYTGVCIVFGGERVVFSEKTDVTFYELTDDEIDEYIKTNECYDKAGAYGIQGRGCTLVKKINGDYFNVVGLPVAKTVRELKKIIKA